MNYDDSQPELLECGDVLTEAGGQFGGCHGVSAVFDHDGLVGEGVDGGGDGFGVGYEGAGLVGGCGVEGCRAVVGELGGREGMDGWVGGEKEGGGGEELHDGDGRRKMHK